MRTACWPASRRMAASVRAGVVGNRLADQGRLAEQPPRDPRLEVAPEGALRAPEEDEDGEEKNQDGPEHQPPGEGHRTRVPRSVARNR